MKKDMHEGHRERMRKRYHECGLESFSDHEALELLLFFALPRRNTNDIAHLLMDHFGSFRAVLEAEEDELRSVSGVGDAAALLIRLVTEMNIRYARSKKVERTVISTSTDAGRLLMQLYAYEKRELAYMLSLDAASRVTHCRKLARGTMDCVWFSTREIIENALADNAAKVIISHNHPCGQALPSPADTHATNQIKRALSFIGVALADHIIVFDDDFVSLYDSNAILME